MSSPTGGGKIALGLPVSSLSTDLDSPSKDDLSPGGDVSADQAPLLMQELMEELGDDPVTYRGFLKWWKQKVRSSGQKFGDAELIQAMEIWQQVAGQEDVQGDSSEMSEDKLQKVIELMIKQGLFHGNGKPARWLRRENAALLKENVRLRKLLEPTLGGDGVANMVENLRTALTAARKDVDMWQRRAAELERLTKSDCGSTQTVHDRCVQTETTLLTSATTVADRIRRRLNQAKIDADYVGEDRSSQTECPHEQDQSALTPNLCETEHATQRPDSFIGMDAKTNVGTCPRLAVTAASDAGAVAADVVESYRLACLEKACPDDDARVQLSVQEMLLQIEREKATEIEKLRNRVSSLAQETGKVLRKKACDDVPVEVIPDATSPIPDAPALLSSANCDSPPVITPSASRSGLKELMQRIHSNRSLRHNIQQMSPRSLASGKQLP